MTEETTKKLLADVARPMTDKELQRTLDKDKMKKSIEVCAAKILAANCWDKVLTFPQLNGSLKVVAASGKFSFLVLADGTILEV